MKKSLVFITILLIGSLSAQKFLQERDTSKRPTPDHLLTANMECTDALKIVSETDRLEAGEITLSSTIVSGGAQQYMMTVYFNRDLTPCNLAEGDGVETRVYMNTNLNVDQRLKDIEEANGGYPENGENAAAWKLIPESCDDTYEYEDGQNDTPLCGDTLQGLNWYHQKVDLPDWKYKYTYWFLFSDMMKLVGDGFLDEVDGPPQSCSNGCDDETNSTVIKVPLAQQWWFEKYEELSNYMNFEFTIKLFQSVDSAKVQIEMVAVEVFTSCENCVVTMKASATAILVKDGTDWNVHRTDNKYWTNSECYIKFQLKNAGNWVGKALELTELSYWRGDKQHGLWKQGEDVDGRFSIKIVSIWHVATGEIRIMIPALQMGHGVKICFEGLFRLSNIDEEAEEIFSFDEFNPTPYSDVPCDQGGACDERLAYRNRRRLVDEDADVIQKMTSSGMFADSDGPEPESSWFSWWYVVILVVVIAVGGGIGAVVAGGKSEFAEVEFGQFE